MANSIDIDVQFQPKQAEAFLHLEEADTQYVFYGGAKGGGKSYLIRGKEIARRLMYPGTTGVIIRKTYGQVLKNHIRKMFQEYPITSEWWRAGDKSIHYPNGSVTDFLHLDSTNDVYDYQGIEYDDITLDEATQHEEEVFEILKTSLRNDPSVKAKNPTFKGKFLLTGNPGGIGHEWVERRFINREFKEEETPEDFHFIQAKIHDNPIFVKANPKYYKNLMDLPEAMRRAYLDGDWSVLAGQYFKGMDESVHIVHPNDIPIHPAWLKFRALDWGFAHDSVCLWFAVDFTGRVIVYRSLVINELAVPELAKKIRSMTPEGENVVATLAGHDLFNRLTEDTYHTDMTRADLFANEGIYLTKAALDRIDGWQAVRAQLDYKRDSDGQIIKHPNLLIYSTCKEVYHGLRRLIHDEIRPEDVKKMKGDDIGDTVRYGVMHVHRGIKPEHMKTPMGKFIDSIIVDHEVNEWDNY